MLGMSHRLSNGLQHTCINHLCCTMLIQQLIVMCQVKFTKVGDASNASWIAQIDPNLRDPTLRTPLCLPMATMIFHAGVVAGEVKPAFETTLF